MVDIVAECRRAVGPDLVLMVDVAYAWPDARTALDVIERLAVLRHCTSSRRRSTSMTWRAMPTFTTAHRSRSRPGNGRTRTSSFSTSRTAVRLDVLQPDVGRVGGFTEALKVCRIAADRIA